ncbi:transglutaminase domain-containing protein [Taibaiella lutea]|uniref:Transglutaminase domain-containing protein n=1 Tax=Taibaiella lutea TaxID=2608001 RepID=A0A5M6CUK6_9BACT|nr:transglutaminase-like domain-containing protein [Taibaiella lutea]KAA5536869.1 transglutaminase domain-containing protein [Taibaiella lutea]
MRIQRATPVNDLLARIIFLLVPTLLVCYFLLWNANQYYTILNNQVWQQTLYVAAGMCGAAVLYGFRFRFLPTIALLYLGFYLVYKGLDAISIGEFDFFFISVQFKVFTITFLFGWILAYGFIRLRFFSIFIAALFLGCCILLISRRSEMFFPDSNKDLLLQFASVVAPIILFSVYIIFTSELIRSYKDKNQSFWWYITRRLLLFAGLCVLLLGIVIFLNQKEIKETIAEYGGGGKDGKNSMLKKNKDNTFDLQQYTKLRGSLGRSNELLFAAHINNFFPDSDVPNPLYLTAFYYSKFDTLTETFERDKHIPANDLYEPDPSQIPLFFPKQDSSVLKYALTEHFRKTIEIEVYKKELSASSFIAPSTSFFVQPITIEKDFQHEFRSAYRAKSYISELNSAYFVYNADEPQVRKFQEQRFEILRKVSGYAGVDAALMKYYTYMPSDAKFNRIKRLADSIAKGVQLPVDKVLAIRDYFLGKDENGKPIYSYTDNPGVPDIPDASKLQYFLFENKKGYCAYYAGATLFMLRALGIPSRITVGFMTVDRSNKNKGWYWYYADQAHAWVQVYFPGYGWLDFDTTVGNDDAQQSPAPDGTPPMQPPKAYLAGDGLVTSVDTAGKLVSLKMSRMVYHDKEYNLQQPVQVSLDVSIASIVKDSTDVALSELQNGDSITAVSYAEVFKNLTPANSETGIALIKRFPSPEPIDEIHIKRSFKQKENNTAPKETIERATNWKAIAIASLAVVLFIIIVILLLPRFIYGYFKMRNNLSKNTQQKAYWSYRSAGFYVHQLGYFKEQNTALQHAQFIDKTFDTNFASFMVVYLKMKYAKQALTQQEENIVQKFLPAFISRLKTQISAGYRFKAFFKVFRSIAFFGVGEE